MVALSYDGRTSTKTSRVSAIRIADGVPQRCAADNEKEALCKEYVLAFARRFIVMFPERRDPFLLPWNEHGVQKFVCTTLRPSLLPYQEVYEIDDIAAFVSRYLHFEPLEPATELPRILPSPAQVLAWKIGDSFDFAVLLASFLLGAGHDAFVVVGYAPCWICNRDESHSACPLFHCNPTSKHYFTRATFPKAALGGSLEALKVDLDVHQRHTQGSQGSPAAPESQHIARGVTVNTQRKRHAWVMVRGLQRNVHALSFIEPTTGGMYSQASAPYLGVEGMWNPKNYWINMQDSDAALSDTNFDMLNPDAWECLFLKRDRCAAGLINIGQSAGSCADRIDDQHSRDAIHEKDELCVARDGFESVDIPPSWVSKLCIPFSDFYLRFPPDGQRTVMYFRCKLELFAENQHDQGMICRLSTYGDLARTIPIELLELFQNRRDKLCTRARLPLLSKLTEEFSPGRSFHLRKFEEVAGVRKDIHFYVDARQDGLMCRQELIGLKIIERFESRADKLVYRSVTVRQDRAAGSCKPQYTLPSGESAGELVVRKMTQKYARNLRLAASENVAKRTYYVQDGCIRSLFHYDYLKTTRSIRVHSKERRSGASIQLDQSCITTASTPPHSDAKNRGCATLDDSRMTPQPVLTAERDCLTEIRRSQLEVLELLKLRRREEMNVVLDRPLFDFACGQRADDNAMSNPCSLESTRIREVDYLTPFLQHVANSDSITIEEAQYARDACLKSLKERLIERANIIMLRLNEENATLAKKQATFQRSQRESDSAAEDDFERFCSNAMFRIQILEQRLSNHEEVALRKFQDLDDTLHVDPRLQALHV